LIGVAGFVAPRHLKAIYDTKNNLVAAVDPHDSVGVLDRYFPRAQFFTEIERFDRHMEKLRRSGDDKRVNYVSICSPNYLHDAHIRLALRVKAHAICEKPAVINPWNIDALSELESETKLRIYTILQLRLHKKLQQLRANLVKSSHRDKVEVNLTYITRRGSWYYISWKGSEEKSGGIAMNIGVHFFDLLIWLFGGVQHSELYLKTRDKMSGMLELEWARVNWYLSLDVNDLPKEYKAEGRHAYRSLTMDGEEIEFSDGFTDLHTLSYSEILDGRGLGIEEARPSIDLVYRIRTADLSPPPSKRHPLLK